MEKKSTNRGHRISSESELLKKPKEVLVKYIIQLENEWYKLSNENKNLKKLYLDLKRKTGKHETVKSIKNKYNTKDSWTDKLVFILNENGKPMNFDEIKSQFLLLEPEISFQWSNLNNQISQIIYRTTVAKEVNKRKIKGEYVYFIA